MKVAVVAKVQVVVERVEVIYAMFGVDLIGSILLLLVWTNYRLFTVYSLGYTVVIH